MEGPRCAACGEAFRPCPRVHDQKYCGKEECRRIRRRRWQCAKRQDDADYRDIYRWKNILGHLECAEYAPDYQQHRKNGESVGSFESDFYNQHNLNVI